MPDRLPILVLIACTSLLAGCEGDSSEPLVPASGVVTLDGQPIEGVAITLVPKEGTSMGRICYGTTDGEGRFELRGSPERAGAIVGEHWAQFVKMTQEDGSPIPEGATPEEVIPFNQLPEAYAESSTTPISVVIPPDGTSDMQFELTSQVRPRNR